MIFYMTSWPTGFRSLQIHLHPMQKPLFPPQKTPKICTPPSTPKISRSSPCTGAHPHPYFSSRSSLPAWIELAGETQPKQAISGIFFKGLVWNFCSFLTHTTATLPRENSVLENSSRSEHLISNKNTVTFQFYKGNVNLKSGQMKHFH